MAKMKNDWKKPAQAGEFFIFLDLDGVIADFDSHAKAHNKPTTGKIDHDSFDFTWWATMPAFTGAVEFYDQCAKRGSVKFLTGPKLNSDCFGGKAEWIQSFHPGRGKWLLRDMIVCNSKDKGLLAGPKRVLIDDREENVRDWRIAGGIGIHHKGDFAKTLAALDRAMRAIAPKPSAPKP
jgi:hypothetical protein